MGSSRARHGLLILKFVAFDSGPHLAAHRPAYGAPPARIWRPAGFHLAASRQLFNSSFIITIRSDNNTQHIIIWESHEPNDE